MTVTNTKPEVITPTATAPIRETEQEFDWKQCWYPVTFVQDLPTDRPYSFSLYSEPLVLFSDQSGKLSCLTDICPHRAAKLSDGQIIDGKIECLYHGWQFGAEGECLHIPQLPSDAKIPAKACVKSFFVVEKQGIIWMWAGEAEAADSDKIPTLPELDKPEVFVRDYMVDLPYDQTYLIENVLDPAHIHISHDGSIGNRQNAQPLEMKVIASSALGIKGQYRYANKANGNWIDLDFVAPNLVTYRVNFNERFLLTALYGVPIEKGRCRLLLRDASNYLSWQTKLKPRWVYHWVKNRILEEDSPFIMAQQAYIEQSGKSMKEVYLPLKTSDELVIAYRKWLDKFGTNMPFYQGYATCASRNGESYQNQSLDRFKQHTQICSSCSRAYRTTIRVKQTLVGVAIALTAVAIITEGLASKIAVSTAILAVILAAVAHSVKTKFERSYTRH